MTLKTFNVSAENAEGSMLVFAASSGRAKSIALRELEFDGCEYIELKVRRERKGDAYATHEHTLTMYTAAEQKIYQTLGWHEYEANSCDGCGKYEFSLLPETELDEYHLCADCAKAIAEN